MAVWVGVNIEFYECHLKSVTIKYTLFDEKGAFAEVGGDLAGDQILHRRRAGVLAADAEELLRAAAAGGQIDDQELRAGTGRLEVHALGSEGVRADASGSGAGGDVDRRAAWRQRELEGARAGIPDEVDASILETGERRLTDLGERVDGLVPVG